MNVLGPSANLLSEVLQVQFEASSVTYMLVSKQQSGTGGGAKRCTCAKRKMFMPLTNLLSVLFQSRFLHQFFRMLVSKQQGCGGGEGGAKNAHMYNEKISGL